MTAVASINLALQLLQQPDLAKRTANSRVIRQAISAATSPQPAEDLFGVNAQNLSKMKVDLYRRVGGALGVKEGDYASFHDYGMALRQAVGQLRLAPNGQQVISAIEKQAGLDKLGVSLDTVVNAIMDPAGSDDDKIDAALKKQMAGDDDGLYGRP